MSHDLDNKREWEQCLQVKDVILPTGYFFGASATTGDLSDAHDIISMKLFELEAPEGASNEDRSKLAPKSSFFEPPRGKIIKYFLFIFLSILNIIIINAKHLLRKKFNSIFLLFRSCG